LGSHLPDKNPLRSEIIIATVPLTESQPQCRIIGIWFSLRTPSKRLFFEGNLYRSIPGITKDSSRHIVGRSNSVALVIPSYSTNIRPACCGRQTTLIKYMISSSPHRVGQSATASPSFFLFLFIRATAFDGVMVGIWNRIVVSSLETKLRHATYTMRAT